MRLLADDGRVLDASLEVEPRPYGVDVILHSRSGSTSGGSTRNPDYFETLETLLHRLAHLNGTVLAVSVDSAVARALSSGERLVDLDYPIRLDQSINIPVLRRRITEGQRKVASRASTQGHRGNNHKRIRLEIDLLASGLDLRGFLTALLPEAESDDGSSGRRYLPAESSPTVRPADLFTFDPGARERGLAAHASIQNGLAIHLERLGLLPFSPTPSEPEFDLAWFSGDTLHVAEVKSLGGFNATQQLRLGLGQVLSYRTALRSVARNVVGVLAVEYEPDPLWAEVCAEVGIVLTWPAGWPGI